MTIKKNTSAFKLIISVLSLALFFSSCSVKPEEKDLSEYGLPVTVITPEDAIITDNFKSPNDPGKVKLRQVTIKNESKFGLFVSMYEQPTIHSVSEIIKHDLVFEKDYASKTDNLFKLIQEDTNGYLYEDDNGFHFYHYLIKNNQLITFKSIKSKENPTLEEIKATYDLIKKAN